MQRHNKTQLQPDALTSQLIDETRAHLKSLGFDQSRVDLRLSNGQRSLFIQPAKSYQGAQGQTKTAWLQPIRMDNFAVQQSGSDTMFQALGRSIKKQATVTDTNPNVPGSHVQATYNSSYQNMVGVIKNALSDGAKGYIKPGQEWQGRSWFQKSFMDSFMKQTQTARVMGQPFNSLAPFQQEREIQGTNVVTSGATSKSHGNSMLDRYATQNGMLRAYDSGDGPRGQGSYAADMLPGNVQSPTFRSNWATGGVTQYATKDYGSTPVTPKEASRMRLEFRNGGLTKERQGANVDAGRYGVMQPVSYRFTNKGEPLTSGAAIMSGMANNFTVVAGTTTRKMEIPTGTSLPQLGLFGSGNYGPGQMNVASGMTAPAIGANGRDVSNVRLSIGHGKQTLGLIDSLFADYKELPAERQTVKMTENSWSGFRNNFKRYNDRNYDHVNTIQAMYQAVTGTNTPVEYGGNSRWKSAVYYDEQQNFSNLGYKGMTGTKAGSVYHNQFSQQLDREDIDMAFGPDVVKNELTFRASNIAGVAHSQEPRFAEAQNWLHQQMGGQMAAERIFDLDPRQVDQFYGGMQQFLPKTENGDTIRTMLGRNTLEYGGSTKLTTNLDTINKVMQGSSTLAKSLYGRNPTAWNTIHAIQNRGGFDITDHLGEGLQGLTAEGMNNSQRIEAVRGFLQGVEQKTGMTGLERQNLSLRHEGKSFTLLPLSQMERDQDSFLAQKYFGALSEQQIAPDDNQLGTKQRDPDVGRGHLLEQYAGGLKAMDTDTLRRSAISSSKGAGGSWQYTSSPDISADDFVVGPAQLKQIAEQGGHDYETFKKAVSDPSNSFSVLAHGWPNVGQPNVLRLRYNENLNQPQTSQAFQIAHRRDDDQDRGYFRMLFKAQHDADGNYQGAVALKGTNEYRKNSLNTQSGAMVSLYAMGGEKAFNAHVAAADNALGRKVTQREILYGYKGKDGTEVGGYNPNIHGFGVKTQNPFADASDDLKKMLAMGDEYHLKELKARDLTPEEVASARNTEAALKKDMGMLNPQRLFEKGFQMIGDSVNTAFPEMGDTLRKKVNNADIVTPAYLMQEEIGRVYQAPLDLVEMNAGFKKTFGSLQYNSTETKSMSAVFDQFAGLGTGATGHEEGRRSQYQFSSEMLGAMFADPSKPEHMKKIASAVQGWRDGGKFNKMTKELWEGKSSVVSEQSMMGRIYKTAQAFHMEQGIKSGELVEDGAGGYVQKDGYGQVSKGAVTSLRQHAANNPELFASLGQVMGKKDTRDLDMFVDAAKAHPIVSDSLSGMGMDTSPTPQSAPAVSAPVGAPQNPAAPQPAAAPSQSSPVDNRPVEGPENRSLYEQAKAKLHGIISQHGSIRDAMKAARDDRSSGAASQFRKALNEFTGTHGAAGQAAYVQAAQDLGIQMGNNANGVYHAYASTLAATGGVNASVPAGTPAAAVGGGGIAQPPAGGGIGGGGGGGGSGGSGPPPNNYTPSPGQPSSGNNSNPQNGNPINGSAGPAPTAASVAANGGLTPRQLAKIQGREIARGLAADIFRKDDALSNFGGIAQQIQKDSAGNYSLDTTGKDFENAARSFQPNTSNMLMNINDYYEGNMGSKEARRSFRKGLKRHAIEARSKGDDDTADIMGAIGDDVAGKNKDYKGFAKGVQASGMSNVVGMFEGLTNNIAGSTSSGELPKAMAALTKSLKESVGFVSDFNARTDELTGSVEATHKTLKDATGHASDLGKNIAAVSKMAGDNPDIRAGLKQARGIQGSIQSMAGTNGTIGQAAIENTGEEGWEKAQDKASGRGGLQKLMSGYMAFQVARSIRFGFGPFEQAAQEYSQNEGDVNAIMSQGGSGTNRAMGAMGNAMKTGENFRYGMGRQFANIAGALPRGMDDGLLGIAGTAASIAGPALGAGMIASQAGEALGGVNGKSGLGRFLSSKAGLIGAAVGVGTGILEVAGAMNSPSTMGRVDNAIKSKGLIGAAFQDLPGFVGYGLTGVKQGVKGLIAGIGGGLGGSQIGRDIANFIMPDTDQDRATFRAQDVYRQAKTAGDVMNTSDMSSEMAAAFIDVGSEEGSMYRGWADQRGLSKPQGKMAMASAFKRSSGLFDTRLYTAMLDATGRGEDFNANLGMADALSQANGGTSAYGGNQLFSGGISEKALTQKSINANLAGGAEVAQELIYSGFAKDQGAVAKMRDAVLNQDGSMDMGRANFLRNEGSFSQAFRSMGVTGDALESGVYNYAWRATSQKMDAGEAMGITQEMAIRKGNYSPTALADYSKQNIDFRAERLANQNFAMLGGDQMAEMMAGTGISSYGDARAGMDAQASSGRVLTPKDRRMKAQNAEMYAMDQRLQGQGGQEGSMTLANLMGPADSDGIYNDLQKQMASQIAGGNQDFGAQIAAMGIFGGDTTKGTNWASLMTPVQRNQNGQLTGMSAKATQGRAAAQQYAMSIAKMGYQGSKTEDGMLMSLDNLMSSGGSFDSVQDVQLQSEASDILASLGVSRDDMETATGNISRGAKSQRQTSTAYSQALASLSRRNGDYSLDGWTKRTGDKINVAQENQAQSNFDALGGEGNASAQADAGGTSYEAALAGIRSESSYAAAAGRGIDPRSVEARNFQNITAAGLSTSLIGSGQFKTRAAADAYVAKSFGNAGAVPRSDQIAAVQQQAAMQSTMATDLMAGGMSSSSSSSSSIGINFASYNPDTGIVGVSDEAKMHAGIASSANSSLNDLVRLGSITPDEYKARYEKLAKSGTLDDLKDISGQVSAASLIRSDGMGINDKMDTALASLSKGAGMEPQQMRSILRGAGNRQGDYSPGAGLNLMGKDFDVAKNMLANQNWDAVGGERTQLGMQALGMGSSFSKAIAGSAMSPVEAQAMSALGGGDPRGLSYAMQAGLANLGPGSGPVIDTFTGGKLFQTTMTGLERPGGGFYTAPPTAQQIGVAMSPMVSQISGGRAGNTGYQGRLNKVMSGSVYGANMGGARGLAMESAVVSRDAAMASAGNQAAQATENHQYAVNVEMPFRWTQQELGYGQQFGGTVQTDYMKKKGIAPMDFGRGDFARQRAGMELQIADMAAQKQQGLSRIGWQLEDIGREQGRTGVRNQWQREDFQLQGQTMQANRAMQTYNFGFQQRELGYQRRDLGIARRENTEDYQYNKGMRQLTHGWAMEDADLNIRRSTGLQRRQLVKERDRAQILNSKESDHDDKLKKRADAAFDRQEETIKRQEEKLKKELDHFKLISKIEDKQFSNEKKRFEQEASWKEEDFNIQKGRLGQEMAWAQESYDRSMAQIELRKEGMAVEEAMAETNHELAKARFLDDEAHEKRMYELALAAAGIGAAAAQKQFEIATNQLAMAIKEEDRMNLINKMLDNVNWGRFKAIIDQLIALSQGGMNFSGSPDDRNDPPPPPPDHAKGGPLNVGANIVGDHGPEMLFQTRSGKTSVLPNSATPRDSRRAPSGGGGSNQQIVVQLDGGVLIDTVIKGSPNKVRIDGKRTMKY